MKPGWMVQATRKAERGSFSHARGWDVLQTAEGGEETSGQASRARATQPGLQRRVSEEGGGRPPL